MKDIKEKFREALQQEFDNEESVKGVSAKFWDALDELMQAHNNLAHNGEPVQCDFRLQLVSLVFHYLDIRIPEIVNLPKWIIATGVVVGETLKDKGKQS